MKKPSTMALLALIALFTSTMAAHAAAPGKINYQGYLTNPGGVPLTGTYPMVFALCDAATAGTCPWSETQSVAIDKGIFNVTLGAVTPLTLAFNIPYFLDITVGGEQMSARLPLTSVGYAFSADRAESVASSIITDANISPTAAIQASKISGLGSLSTKNSIANSDLDPGSFSNITGVGALTDLNVSGNANLATTSGAVGIKTTTPRASLEVGGTDGLLVTGTRDSGTVSALGAGVRMHWYPRKGAFRVGMAEANYWDDNGSATPNLALFSIGMGWQARPTGAGSVAIGTNTKATGDYTLSLGSSSLASGPYDIAIGNNVTASGGRSIAMGGGADTNLKFGSVVIGDAAYFPIAYATNDNQITMRFIGGLQGSCRDDNIMNDGGVGTCKAYRFMTNYDDGINVYVPTGAYMNGGVSGWINYSSRDMKENFRKLDGEELLGKIRNMSITEWNYKGAPKVKYIGPVAEEFWDSFHLDGDDKKGINSISIDGVNMAGVQALEKRTGAMKSEMAEMKAMIELLKAEIAMLKAQLAAK